MTQDGEMVQHTGFSEGKSKRSPMDSIS